MAISDFRKLTTTAECIDHHVVFVGGTAAVTKLPDTGVGVTVTYVSAGLVNLTWSDAPGVFIGIQTNFQATVPAALKGYTCVAGVYNTTTNAIQLSITGDGAGIAPALTDLAALQWLLCTVTFKRSGSGV